MDRVIRATQTSFMDCISKSRRTQKKPQRCSILLYTCIQLPYSGIPKPGEVGEILQILVWTFNRSNRLVICTSDHTNILMDQSYVYYNKIYDLKPCSSHFCTIL